MQSEKDWEAIIIDDGSTDNSSSIGLEYAKIDSRFHLFRQVNGGVSSARNKGLSYALGDWICFVDADDQLPKDALQILLQNADKNYDLIIGGYVVFDTTNTESYSIEERVFEVLNRESAISLMYKPRYYRYLGFVWGKLFKASIIREYRLMFDPQICFNEDRLFVTQYISRCNQIVLVTQPVYHYFERPGSAMASLNNSFNIAFLTDIDGFIGMKESIEAANGSKELLQLAQEGILSSYNRIKEMMNTHNNKQLKYLLLLEKKLIEGLSFPFYLKFRLKVLRDKCLNGNSRSSVSAS